MRRQGIVGLLGLSLLAPNAVTAQRAYVYGHADVDTEIKFFLGLDQTVGDFWQRTAVGSRVDATFRSAPDLSSIFLNSYASAYAYAGSRTVENWTFAHAGFTVFNQALTNAWLPIRWAALSEGFMGVARQREGEITGDVFIRAMFQLSVHSGRDGAPAPVQTMTRASAAKTRYNIRGWESGGSNSYSLFLPAAYLDANGQIVPSASRVELQTQAFARATLTPEPLSVALLGTGLAGIVAARRRREQPE